MQKSKIIPLVVISLLLLVVGASAFWYSTFNTYAPKEYMKETKNEITGTTTITTVNTETKTETAGAKSFTLAEISTHKDATSCYTVIKSVVYDLTLWVNLHPGGKGAILSICGVDGTERFMKKHGDGEKFMKILERYKIGLLKQS